MHGTARIAEWEFDPVEELPEDLRFSHDLMVKEPWSEKTQPCTAGLSAQLEENKLVVNLGLLNNGDKAVQAEMMLHAYFLASIKKTTITGFEGRKYRNMVVDGYPTQTQTGPIGFPADHETSMLFLGQESKCSILDAEKRRRIGVESEGLSALVWNAGRKKAEGMPDFYSQHWDQTLCVETGGAKANSRAVQPGERWYYKTTYSINAL
jgi:D-hexose-6-phosphate mutarotase